MSLSSAKYLLLKCGGDWKKMALVVSMPVQPEMKTTEFDVLMGELQWKLAMSEYLLYLGMESNVQWKWCTRSCKFKLLIENKPTGGGEAGEMFVQELILIVLISYIAWRMDLSLHRRSYVGYGLGGVSSNLHEME